MKNLTLKQLSNFFLLIIIFFLPWQTRWIIIPGLINNEPWEYGTFSIYAIDVLFFLFVVAGVMEFFEHKHYRHFSILQYLAVMLLIIAFFSTYFAGHNDLALYSWLKLAGGLFLFILVPIIKPNFNRTAIVLILTGVIQSLLGFWQFFIQRVDGTKWLGMAAQNPLTLGAQVVETSSGRILRAYGALSHPNMLAGFLVVGAIVCLFMYFKQKPSLKRIFTAAALPIFGTGLWVTFSRQAWIALGVIIIILMLKIFFAQSVFPKQLVAAIFFLISPIIVFTLIFPDFIKMRVANNTRLEERSITERVNSLKESISILPTSIVKGVGMGNYTAFFYDRDEKNNSIKQSYSYQPVHNIYLLILNELGFFGLLAFIFLMFCIFFNGNLLNPWKMALAALLIVGLFDHYLWSLSFGVMFFWIVAAMANNKDAF